MTEIKKLYYTTKEVGEALGVSNFKVFELAKKAKIPYKGSRAKRKFTDYDINKMKNQTLIK